VINTNLAPIFLRFRDIAFDRSKIAIFGYPCCVTPPTEGFPGMISVKFYQIKKMNVHTEMTAQQQLGPRLEHFMSTTLGSVMTQFPISMRKNCCHT